jgi:hypothetical protein
MKMLIGLLFILLSFSLRSQEVESDAAEDPTELGPQQEGETVPKKEAPTMKVECICLQQDQEVPQALPGPMSYFPENSVFIITPWPSLPEAPPVERKREIIPGYIEKLESGYSDESYKQIP